MHTKYMLSFPTLWHVFVFGMPYKSIRNLVQLTWIYLSFQFISCIPLLYRIPSSCLLISPFTKHLQGNFKTDSDGMWDIHYNSWKIKKKITIIYKPNFFQRFPWVLRGTSYRENTKLQGNKHENQEKRILKWLLYTAAKQLAHSSGKNKNKQNRETKQRNPK